MRSMLRGRTLGTSSRGYIGAFLAAAQIGDQIWVILGSNLPLLLRPVPDRDGYFRLVGQCYVAGLMEGEALLGPLSDRWQFGTVDKNRNRIYVYDETRSTLEDPRFGPLPPEWRIVYEGGEETDKDGNLSYRSFVNDTTGEETWADPRLTKDALIQRGVDIKEFILV